MTLKILIITQNFWPEKFGNVSRINDLSKFLVKLGAKVTIITPHPTFPFGTYKRKFTLKNKVVKDGIEIIRILSWQPTNQNPKFIDRMGYYLTFPIHAIFWSILKRNEYSIVITTVPPIFTGITAIFIKKIIGKKWIFDIRDLWIDASISLGFLKRGGFFEKISRIYEEFCYKSCDLITVTTNKTKKIISTKNNCLTDKIILMPNGVDENIYKPFYKNKKKNYLVYSGLIGTAQDLELVIHAFKEVITKYDMKFLIIGDGEKRKQLEQIVKKESLDEHVIFTGLIDRNQVPNKIAESLIGIAPIKDLESLYYAIPTKVYEYMSCGIPFIATGKGEIENIIANSEAGLLADNTHESIAQKIIYLLDNPKKIEIMGKNGRLFIKQNNTRKKIAENFYETLKKI